MSRPAENIVIPEQWTLPSAQRDFVEWRQGRTQFAVWAIDLDLPALAALSDEYRQRLKHFLLADYVRQPHITLQIAGFPSALPRFADDFTADRRQAQLDRLRAIKQAPFAIEVAGIDSFSSAAYFAVNDCFGGIAKIRQALAWAGDDNFPFTPHVTFGLYRAVFAMAEVRRKLSAAPAFAPLPLTINKISLMTYQAAVIGGALSPILEFDLSRQQVLN